MQSIFALQQSIEANYQLCFEHIDERFSPDLNSMVTQDKELLRKQKAQALKIFESAFAKKEVSVEDADDAVQKTVNGCFISYKNASQKDTEFFRKNMIMEVEKIHDHYLSVLNLLAAFAEVAAADKRVSHDNFTANTWITALKDSKTLKDDSSKIKSWPQDKVKTWFRDVVRQEPEYLAYQDKKKPSLEDQKKFVNYFFKKIILGKNVIHDHFEEEILRWAEDKDIIKGLVEKTVKSFNPEENNPIKLHSLSLNWEEDLEFIEKLYSKALELDDRHRNLIAQNTRNWDVERLPATDRIILEMAIAELLTFPNIPVKVTINEYIELAKNYSTPKSRQFINGILDVIAKELQDEGAIRKSGRGLIDNK